MSEPEEPAEAQASLAWETDGDMATVSKTQDLEQGGSHRAGGQLVGMPALPWDTRNSFQGTGRDWAWSQRQSCRSCQHRDRPWRLENG